MYDDDDNNNNNGINNNNNNIMGQVDRKENFKNAPTQHKLHSVRQLEASRESYVEEEDK